MSAWYEGEWSVKWSFVWSVMWWQYNAGQWSMEVEWSSVWSVEWVMHVNCTKQYHVNTVDGEAFFSKCLCSTCHNLAH